MKIKNIRKAFFISLICFLSFNNNSSAGVVADIDLDGKVDGYDAYLLTKIPAGSKPSAVLSPVRFFSLNTSGQPVDVLAPSIDVRLYENDSVGNILRSWKSKYQKKGQYRSQCDPPMFNISFDKFDSEGRPRFLFPGWATAPAVSSPLQYQEVRVVEKCDNTHGVLLNGNVVTQMVESSIFRIMRSLKVPTLDVVAFGKLGFVNAEPKYNGKVFNYTFIQRDNEEDDQISFSKQYGFRLPIVQATERDLWQQVNVGDYQTSRLKGFTVLDVANNKNITLSLDPDNSLRTLMMFNFFQDGDKVNMHNEDYGQMADGKWRRIPYGFDLALTGCNARPPEFIIDEYVMTLPESEREMYYEKLAVAGYEIFGKSENLYNMLHSVDSYPFVPMGDRQKNLLKKYYRLSFYEYADYFQSGKFTFKTGVPIDSRFEKPDYLFRSSEEYDEAKSKFISTECLPPNPLPPPNISVWNKTTDHTVTVSERIELGRGQDDQSIYGYHVDTVIEIGIKSESQDIEFPKYGALGFNLVNQDNDYLGYVNANYDRPEGMIEGVGVYILPKGVAATLKARISEYVYEPNHLGKLKFVTNSLWLGRKFNRLNFDDIVSREFSIIDSTACPASNVTALLNPLTVSPVPTLQAKGELIELVGLRKYPVISVPSSVTIGNTYDIRWNPIDGTAPFDVYLKNSSGFSERIERVSVPYLSWKVPTYLAPGNYYLEVSSVSCSNLKARSNVFNVSAMPPAGSADVKAIKNSMEFLKAPDGSSKELSLRTIVAVEITAKVPGIKIGRDYIGGLTATDLSNQHGNQYIYATAGATSVIGAISEDKTGYTLPVNVPVKVVVTGAFNPNQMFAGNYKTSLSYLTLFDANGNKREVTFTNRMESTAIAIFGERAPYIERINAVSNGLPGDSEITIFGERFSLTNNTLKLTRHSDRRDFTFQVPGVGTGHIVFKLSDKGLLPGAYNITIASAEGDSNTAYIDTEADIQAKKSGFMANVLEAIKKVLGI